MCFAGARYSQDVSVALEGGGSVLVLDGYACGRAARGERWKFAALRTRTAVLRGKVWPRDKDEPKEWSVEFEDPCPNRAGSPVLYGYSKGILNETSPGTEIDYDSLRVTPNK